jgi:hypothetical protein
MLGRWLPLPLTTTLSMCADKGGQCAPCSNEALRQHAPGSCRLSGCRVCARLRVGAACLRGASAGIVLLMLRWCVSWLAGWLVGWLAGWLVGWLAGCRRLTLRGVACQGVAGASRDHVSCPRCVPLRASTSRWKPWGGRRLFPRCTVHRRSRCGHGKSLGPWTTPAPKSSPVSV